MDQTSQEKGWQQLQTHIQGFFGQALRSDIKSIEYKPRFIVHQLEMPPKYRKKEFQKIAV